MRAGLARNPDRVVSRHAPAGAPGCPGGGPTSAHWTAGEVLSLAAGLAEEFGRWEAGVGEPVPVLAGAGGLAQVAFLAGALTSRPMAPVGTRLTTRELEDVVAPLPGTLLLAERRFEEPGRALAERTARRLHFLDDVVPSAHPLPEHPPASGPVALLHTSGTTGRPKPVPVHDRTLLRRSAVMAGVFGLERSSRFAATAPLHHVAGYGMLTAAMAVGAEVVAFDRFSAEAWQELGAMGVTHVSTVSAMIETLVEQGRLAIPGLQALSYGGSRIRTETLRQALQMLPSTRFVALYGQTEGSPISFLSDEDHRVDRPELLRTAGRPVPGVDIVIDAPDDRGIGEIVAAGEHFFLVDADGQRRTGDMGSFRDGVLTVHGRSGDMLICGGENLYPVEVESVLARHPAVEEAVVVGVPDGRLGQVPVAYLRLRSGVVRPSAVELRDFARRDLAGFKVPRRWHVVDEFPRNAAGKVLRQRLDPAAPSLRN